MSNEDAVKQDILMQKLLDGTLTVADLASAIEESDSDRADINTAAAIQAIVSILIAIGAVSEETYSDVYLRCRQQTLEMSAQAQYDLLMSAKESMQHSQQDQAQEESLPEVIYEA